MSDTIDQWPAGDTRFTPETARQAAEASAEARRRKAALTPEERAAEAARKESPQLVAELLDAARGRGDFEKLKPEDRLRALFRALEYGLGRPEVRSRVAPEQDVPTLTGIFGDQTP